MVNSQSDDVVTNKRKVLAVKFNKVLAAAKTVVYRGVTIPCEYISAGIASLIPSPSSFTRHAK